MRKLNIIPSDLKVGDTIWAYKTDKRLCHAEHVKVEEITILKTYTGKYNGTRYIMSKGPNVYPSSLNINDTQRTFFYMTERDDSAFRKEAASIYERIRDSRLSKAYRSMKLTDKHLEDAAKAQRAVDRINSMRIDGPGIGETPGISDLDIERMRKRMMELTEAK